jgi:exopolysaccharide biosynthesis polyprenyl glycosylphosphotransferase
LTRPIPYKAAKSATPEVIAAGARPLAGIIPNDQVRKALLLAGDVGVLYLSLTLALVIRLGVWPSSYWFHSSLFVSFTVLFAIWVLVFYIGDLYELSISKNEFKFYNRLLKVLGLNFTVAAVYFYFASRILFEIQPQVVLITFAIISAILMSFWRYRYNAFVLAPTMQRNVLVVGLNDGAHALIEEIVRNPQLGYRIPAVVHSPSADIRLPGVTRYDESVDLKTLLIEENIDTVVTAFDPRTNSRLLQQLFDNLALKVRFFELPIFYERLTGKVPVTNIGHIWFLENLASSDKSFYEFLKRTSDIVLASILLAIALPFIPLIVLAIKLDSNGPVLFFQKRVGLLGRSFHPIKFRTMYVEAESDGVARWAQKNDPRITRVGRFLRKTRIDELPQLWNVLRGEMSMIGPRPERPEFVRELETYIPFYNERHLVKPGITGWAQVRFRYGASLSDSFTKLEYDFFYIKNRSIALDVAIVLKTISIVLTGDGQ